MGRRGLALDVVKCGQAPRAGISYASSGNTRSSLAVRATLGTSQTLAALPGPGQLGP